MTKKWWSSEEITVDLFAGGGGASEGIRMSIGRDPDIAINHDEIAIAMHRANHPGTKHYIDDIWKVQPSDATQGRPVGLLWASPDCKHFSVAKGAALFRSKEIRALAWVVIKWAKTVKPRLIILENVSEFRTWGPLDSEGRIKKDQKKFTMCFCGNYESLDIMLRPKTWLHVIMGLRPPGKDSFSSPGVTAFPSSGRVLNSCSIPQSISLAASGKKNVMNS